MPYRKFCHRTNICDTVRNRITRSVALGLLAATVASSTVRAQSLPSPSPTPTPIANGTALDTIVRHHLNGDYVLTGPIYLNETNGGQWTPIGSLDQPFTGTLDGNGHIIYGLNVTTTGDRTPTGLFGKIQSSWVGWLILDRPLVQSFGHKSHTGPVAGVADHSHITGSTNLFGVVRSYGGNACTGGINGYAAHSTVRGNLNTGTVRSNGTLAFTGGTTGQADDHSTIRGNLNTGAVSSNGTWAFIGGTTGYAYRHSTVRGNQNTGAIRSGEYRAYIGGTNGLAVYSTVRDNLNTGTIRSNGTRADTGGTTGYAYYSTVSGNLNTGAVSSNGKQAETGGTIGYANKASTISSNLNTGTVHSNGIWAYTGGTTGFACLHSTVSGNLNTGTVHSNGIWAYIGGTNGVALHATVSDNLNTGTVRSNGTYAHIGGTTGYAKDSTVSGNLNTGAVSSNGTDTYTGGTTGYANKYSTVSDNLNTGTIRSNGTGARTGGITGQAYDRSTVRGNLNAGTVSSNGTDTYTGGTTGYADKYSTVRGNLNTGTVHSNGTGTHTGGLTGYAAHSTVSGNLNTGAVSANGTNAWAGPAAGGIYSLNVKDNLNTGTVTSQSSLFETRGVLNLNETQIQSGNNGLSNATWHNGKDTQYPMPRGINAVYQDLRRINGTRNGNHANIFPLDLNEFADPGGPKNDSLFDRALWNVWDGYLPLLKHVSQKVAEQVGLDCGPGGFACGSCPVPMAVPYFQLFDPDTDHLYVVAYQSRTNQLLLVRYTAAGSLDEAFGECGVQAWSAPGSAAIQDGVIHKGNLYLALADALLVWPLAGGADHLVPVPEGVGLHSLMVRDSVLYYGGQRHGDVLVGKVSLPLALDLTGLPDNTLAVSGAGFADTLMMAGGRLYAAGQGEDNGLAYQYQPSLVSVPFASGRDRIDIVLDGFPNQTRSRVRALAAHDDWLYLVGNLDSPGRDEDLFIRRYRLENGEADESFVVSLSTGVDGGVDEEVSALDHEVHVWTSENGLTVFRHGTDDNQVFIGSWNWQGQAGSDNGLHRFPGMARLARGLGLESGQMYLAGADEDGFLMVTQSAWTLPGSPSSFPGWVWPTVATGGLVSTLVGVAVVAIPVILAVRRCMNNKGAVPVPVQEEKMEQLFMPEGVTAL